MTVELNNVYFTGAILFTILTLVGTFVTFIENGADGFGVFFAGIIGTLLWPITVAIFCAIYIHEEVEFVQHLNEKLKSYIMTKSKKISSYLSLPLLEEKLLNSRLQLVDENGEKIEIDPQLLKEVKIKLHKKVSEQISLDNRNY